MPENPLTKFEFRLAREQRRTARITAKSARIVAKYDYKKACVATEDNAMAHWFVPWITGALCIVLSTFIICGYTSGILKHAQEQSQVTACEKYVTQANVEADCSTGKIQVKGASR
jgi:hypothetical protein